MTKTARPQKDALFTFIWQSSKRFLGFPDVPQQGHNLCPVVKGKTSKGPAKVWQEVEGYMSKVNVVRVKGMCRSMSEDQWAELKWATRLMATS